jgi:hypothetical protein
VISEEYRDEILKLLTRLFYSPGCSDLYKDYAGKLNYDAFQEKLLQSLETKRAEEDHRNEPNLPFIFRAFSEIVSQTDILESHQVNSEEHETYFNKIHSLLMSPDYSPPADWKDIVFHLACLFNVWDLNARNPGLHKDFCPLSDLLLLLSFAKLMGASSELLAKYTIKGCRETSRTKKASKSKKAKTYERKGFVIAIYEYGETIAHGTKFSKVYKLIKKQFDNWRGKEGPWGIIPMEEKMPTPSRDSVYRYLSEAGILERDFTREGNYLIKQT